MPNDKLSPLQGLPGEIIVQVLEEAEEYAALAQLPRPEAGVYDPVFSLWDGTALLDFLFKATESGKLERGMAHVLLLSLRLPKVDSAQPPL